MRRAIGPVALRVPGGGPEEGKGVFDGLVGDLAVAGDAVGVHTEQDVDAVGGAGGVPGLAVTAFVQDPAPRGAEQPPVRASAVSVDVRAKEPGELRGDGHGADGAFGPELEAALLVRGPVAG